MNSIILQMVSNRDVDRDNEHDCIVEHSNCNNRDGNTISEISLRSYVKVLRNQGGREERKGKGESKKTNYNVIFKRLTALSSVQINEIALTMYAAKVVRKKSSKWNRY